MKDNREHSSHYSIQKAHAVKPGASWEEVYKAITARKKDPKAPLDPAALRLLEAAADTFVFPVSLSALAMRAGLGGPEATRASKELQQRGLARRCPLVVGRRRNIFIDPTEQGFKLLGISAPSGAGRGGAGHRHCLGLAQKHLEKHGYRTQREIEVAGKRIDLIARKGNQTLFIECEMSAQNASRNAMEDLRAAEKSVRSIVFVSPNAKTLKAVEKAVRLAAGSSEMQRFKFKLAGELK